MELSAGSVSNRRPLVLLAPLGVEPTSFVDVIGDQKIYNRVLSEMQKFRGQVYVSEGNLEPLDLTADGRHVQEVDLKSWHLLTLNESGSVAACGRILLHRPNPAFGDLLVSHCALAQSEGWGFLLRRAVEEQIRCARQCGLRFAEIGGWAVDRNIRCTTEAVRLVVAGYALGQLLGGVFGITTANLGHHSSSILRRIGGVPLTTGEVPFPAFYEPQYRAELEILCLESFRPNPAFQHYVQDCIATLETATVISSISSVTHLKSDKRNPIRDVYIRTLTSTKAELAKEYDYIR